MTSDQIIQKVREKGLKGTAKAIGRALHGRYSHPGYGKDVLAPILEEIAARQQKVTIVQVGANTGNTDSDPIHEFIVHHFSRDGVSRSSDSRAILIEPVKHLYDQLVANYAGFDGVRCVNAAIGELPGTKTFYRFKDDIDPVALGLHPHAHQFGTFDRDFILRCCPSFADPVQRDEFIKTNIIATEVQCVTLMELLETEGIKELDMLVVDTEGYDYQILKTIDFSAIVPSYINYERVHLKKDEAACRRLMIDHGYDLYDHSDDTLCTRGRKSGRLRKWKERIYLAWLEAIF